METVPIPITLDTRVPLLKCTSSNPGQCGSIHLDQAHPTQRIHASDGALLVAILWPFIFTVTNITPNTVIRVRLTRGTPPAVAYEVDLAFNQSATLAAGRFQPEFMDVELITGTSADGCYMVSWCCPITTTPPGGGDRA